MQTTKPATEATAARLAQTRTDLAQLLKRLKQFRGVVYDIRKASASDPILLGRGTLDIISHNVAQRVTELVHELERRELELRNDAEWMVRHLYPDLPRPEVTQAPPKPPGNYDLEKIFGRHRRKRGR